MNLLLRALKPRGETPQANADARDYSTWRVPAAEVGATGLGLSQILPAGSSPTSAACGRTHRVVLIDDHSDMRFLLRTLLGSLDDIDVVGEAANGLDGVAVVRALMPDAVVLDLEMPLMRGDQAIPIMRAAAPELRIVMYSAAGGPSLASFADESKPDFFVQKGSPASDLISRLRTAIHTPRQTADLSPTA